MAGTGTCRWHVDRVRIFPRWTSVYVKQTGHVIVHQAFRACYRVKCFCRHRSIVNYKFLTTGILDQELISYATHLVVLLVLVGSDLFEKV